MTCPGKISIIIPCRNEEEHISACLTAVLAFDYPMNYLEILVVDGMSTDATREIINDYITKYPFIKLLDNFIKIVPTAMNIGIKAATGEFIARLDAHSEYPRSYIKDCLALIEKTGAANAGGRFVTIPNSNGPWAVPVAEVTAHRFGVGAGAFRVGAKPGFVDTVPFGFFRRDLFEKIGLFNERLTRNQDNELNARIRRHGYKIAFDPAIQILYKNQPTLTGLIRQGFFTGMWNVYTLTLHPYTFQWRRFVPAVFVSYLLLIPLVFILSDWVIFYLLPAVLYIFINLAVAVTRDHNLSVKARIAITFVSYHLAYGAGTLFGIINIITGHWKNYFGKPIKK